MCFLIDQIILVVKSLSSRARVQISALVHAFTELVI